MCKKVDCLYQSIYHFSVSVRLSLGSGIVTASSLVLLVNWGRIVIIGYLVIFPFVMKMTLQ